MNRSELLIQINILKQSWEYKDGNKKEVEKVNIQINQLYVQLNQLEQPEGSEFIFLESIAEPVKVS